jgi:AmiR/NasT family two-component response regulator
MGVLMGQAHVTADEAFEMLRRRSQHSNTKLRDVAATIVADAVRHR